MPDPENIAYKDSNAPEDYRGESGGGTDKYRESPELKINKALGKAVDSEAGVVCRDMPRIAEDEAFMFGKPNQLNVAGASDFRPDAMESSKENPMHVINEEDNTSILRKK